MDEYTRIIYTSVASKSMKEDVLTDILEKSRVRNQQDAITGILFYRNGTFIQLLEGPSDKVEETYNRIKKDKRHFKIRLVNCVTKEPRIFPAWSMAFGDDSTYDPALFENIDGLLDELEATPLGNGDIWQILTEAAIKLHKSVS